MKIKNFGTPVNKATIITYRFNMCNKKIKSPDVTFNDWKAENTSGRIEKDITVEAYLGQNEKILHQAESRLHLVNFKQMFSWTWMSNIHSWAGVIDRGTHWKRKIKYLIITWRRRILSWVSLESQKWYKVFNILVQRILASVCRWKKRLKSRSWSNFVNKAQSI